MHWLGMYFQRPALCASLNSAAVHSAQGLQDKRTFSTKMEFRGTRADRYMAQGHYLAVRPEVMPDTHYLSLGQCGGHCCT